MATINKKKPKAPAPKTHEGGSAKSTTAEQALRRSLFSCMLWEKEFYEDGQSIAQRIASLVPQVDPLRVKEIAEEARTVMNLRHAPLMVAYAMTKHETHRPFVADTLEAIIQRPDELVEYLAIYFADGGRRALSAQSKKGLARAFAKFNEYSLAKYDRDGKAISLQDVMFLCHAKPKDGTRGYTRDARKNPPKRKRKLNEGQDMFDRLVKGELTVPDTWEVALSAAKDKAAEWTRLLREGKLGALALLRNLRNFAEAKVDDALIRKALAEADTRRVLPFRFIAAARFAPHLEPDLEKAMFRCVEAMAKLPGDTLLLVDVSGSMSDPLSGKSDMRRIDAAHGLAMILREVAERLRVVKFRDGQDEVPARRGFGLRDAIGGPAGGTRLGAAVEAANAGRFGRWDRLVVISDEQTADRVPDPKGRAYMLNVASAQNGVGYRGNWIHLDGFSEAVVGYMAALEEGVE